MDALIAIDDRELRQQVASELGRLGLQTTTVESIEAWIAAGRADCPDLIVGTWWKSAGELAWCRQYRERFPHYRTVILVATDRTLPADLGHTLDAGADDYFHWPDSSILLHHRLRIAVRRASDRSDRNHSERKLRETIERFELAVEGANDGLWDAFAGVDSWNRPDSHVWYSNRFWELLGYRRDELPPNVFGSWEALLYPEDHDRVIAALVAHISHRIPYDVEYRLLTKSGEYRWFSARGQAIWKESGELVRMSGSLRDITQAKEFEVKLQESEEKWRSLVHNAPEIVVLTDPEARIRFVNRMTHLAEQAKGRSVYEYVDPDYLDVTKNAFARLMDTGEPQSYEVQSQAVGGGMAWYATRLGPIWQDGKIASIVLIATNITQRKFAEDQLQRERNALRRLLDIQERERRLVSYEIHDGLVQYLTAGLMHLEASTGPQDAMAPAARADYQRGVELLREALEEGRRLIGDLRPPILDERGILEALQYLVSEFRHDIPGLTFVEHAPCGRLAPPLEVAIFRVTQEALSNVRKHSESDRAQVELLQHGEWLRLIVRDWGKGFNPDEVREDRYGLQGIRQRARLLGTRAVIESQPGRGTSIVVDFPIVLAPTPEESRQTD